MVSRRAISSPGAPKAIGPYSQAIAAGGMLFCSGQIPLDPATGGLVTGDITLQTRRVMENLRAVLQAGGAGFQDVVKTTVFLSDLAFFAQVNEVYAEYFNDGPPPARATVAVKSLPRGADIEIDAIAVLGTA